MQVTNPVCRSLMAGAAAALLPMRDVVAHTAAAKGDGMAMAKGHHALIAKTFDELLATDGKPAARPAGMRKLAHQLTAHSVAEENVLYAAMAMNGMVSEADKLYLDQAHAKVMNHQLEMMAKMNDAKGWLDTAKTMPAAVLKHAEEGEEANLCPKLKQAMDASKNAMLTAACRREFSHVKQA